VPTSLWFSENGRASWVCRWLTVWTFFQIFALWQRSRGPLVGEQAKSVGVQAVLLYSALTVSFFLASAAGDRKIVTDTSDGRLTRLSQHDRIEIDWHGRHRNPVGHVSRGRSTKSDP
jgi:hypothetical protein